MKRWKRYCGLGVTLAVVFSFLSAPMASPAASANLLDDYESESRQFKEIEIGDKIVYFHMRMIGEAAVEKDYIVYQFDEDTKELLARKTHWREGLPDGLPEEMISREQAESMIEGEVLFSRLYYISPESDVFPMEPAPQDPCWVVRSLEDGNIVVTIINAVDGALLGNGVPPPYTAFSYTGPISCPLSGGWYSWYQNAETWFNTMGYSTDGTFWPELSRIRSHVKSDTTAMFYEIGHGDYSRIQYTCDESTAVLLQAFKVGLWIQNFAKMPFTFIGSCGGMCDTTSGSFSYELRKGSYENTTSVGYCDMAEPWCADCWTVSLSWQDAFFGYVNMGWTVKAAFDQADADYPVCAMNGCFLFAGDEAFAVVPVVTRDPLAPQVEVLSPNGGEVLEYGTDHEIRWGASDNARVTSITILLSTDSGVSFPDTISKDEPNDSSYMWTLPDVDSKTARIKVIAYDGALNEGVDLSDGDFTLWGSTSGVDRVEPPGRPDEVALGLSGGSLVGLNATVVFGLPSSGHVRIGVYDVTGKHVRDLVNAYRDEGYHTLEWNCTGETGSRLGPGMYFIRLESNAGSASTKVIMTR